ncbi:MAG: hypothetical protein ACOYYS_06200 [Chloroflexota bacterium]
MLQIAHILTHCQCHALRIFALAITQQTTQMGLPFFLLLAPPKRRTKQRPVGFQFARKLLNIAAQQITDRFWARFNYLNFGYNSAWHGFRLLPSWSIVGERYHAFIFLAQIRYVAL